MTNQQIWESLELYESFSPVGDIVLGRVLTKMGTPGTRYLLANVPATISTDDAITTCRWFGWEDAYSN